MTKNDKPTPTIPDIAPDALRASLKKALSDASLPDEARLRLYEKFNEERARRGESLLTIPADLLARVKAKAKAAPEAAKQAAAGGKESAALVAQGGAHLARTTGRGGKRLGDKMKQGARHAGRNMADVAKTMGKTAATVGRITMLESVEVLSEAPRSKRHALLTPPKLMGKGMKAGVKLATGAAKAAAKTAKGGAVMAKDAASVTATGMVESARVGKALAETSDQLRQAGEAAAQSGKDALKIIKDA